VCVNNVVFSYFWYANSVSKLSLLQHTHFPIARLSFLIP
jgi:hypothetical protein